jgi:hypothetical protein
MVMLLFINLRDFERMDKKFTWQFVDKSNDGQN